MFFNHAQHIRVADFDDWISNNVIESFNGQFKAWYRPKRGFNSFACANNLVAMYLFFYNFLRPHAAGGDLTVRNTKEQTAYILQLKKAGQAKVWQRLAWAGAAACLVVLIVAATFLTGLIDWPFPSESTPGTSEIPFLSWDGVFYSPIEDRSQLFDVNTSALTITLIYTIGRRTNWQWRELVWKSKTELRPWFSIEFKRMSVYFICFKPGLFTPNIFDE